MRKILSSFLASTMVLTVISPGLCQQSIETRGNVAELRGSDPFKWNVLPDLPPNGFFAWCNTSRGFCLVEGRIPIAPGSLCHCMENPGNTL
jgi:hypothetical protein